MLKRNVPDGEGLVFCITGLDATLVFVIKLRKTSGHFAAAGSRRRDYHKGASGLDIFIFTVAVVADDELRIGGVTGNGIMPIYLKPEGFELLLISYGAGLICKSCQADAADIQAISAKGIDQTKNVHVISDAKIGTHLVFLDVCGIDDDNDLGLVL